jgi:predicted RNA-binding protein with PUA-like domain
MKYWLMKSEPDCYCIDDLKKRKGVRSMYAKKNRTKDNKL